MYISKKIYSGLFGVMVTSTALACVSSAVTSVVLCLSVTAVSGVSLLSYAVYRDKKNERLYNHHVARSSFYREQERILHYRKHAYRYQMNLKGCREASCKSVRPVHVCHHQNPDRLIALKVSHERE